MMALFDLLAGRGAVLDDGDWGKLLVFADRTLSTPLLQGKGPAWIQAEVEQRVLKVARKRIRLQETYREAAAVLSRAGIEFILLKGFTHGDPRRVQNDVDLWVRDVSDAQRVLLGAGFVRHRGPELSYNHAAPLLKPHVWSWRGDYFDPEMPVPIELHHTLWNRERERIAVPGIEAWWDRRVIEGGVPALSPPDRLGFAALHLLRHILRNDLRPWQAWELAHMTEHAAYWGQGHTPEVRRLTAIACKLAAWWFDRELPAAAQREWAAMPRNIGQWVERCGWSPLRNLVEPNKDSIRLHLALVEGVWNRAVVARRRLLPVRLPWPNEAAGESYAALLLGRARYHAVALARLLSDAKTSHTSD